MEQPLRSRRRLIVALALVVVLLAIVFLRPHRDQVAGHAFPIPSADDRILVEVLNATGRQGLARLGTRQLRRQGLDVVFFGNADSTVDSTRIIARRGKRDDAERVQKALGLGRVLLQSDTLLRVDVSVLLGSDYQPHEADGRP